MACKVTKNVEHRQLTLAEFKKQKGYGEYKQFRQIAKAENFSLIFGGAASVLSQYSLEVFWTIDEVNKYLEDNHCEKELEEVKAKYRSYTDEHCRFIAAATRMRDGFFKGYPGLLERCDREVEYAKKHGYCRSVFGGTRNQIELLLRGAYDDKYESGRLKNIENISKNYLAQQLEACIRGRAMREMAEWLEEKGYKSRVWNEIHDSVDLWVHKDEANEVLPHFKHLLERRVPELMSNWVPLPADCEVSDLREGQYYKGGTSPESHGISWDDGEYLDPDPFCVELSDELESDYFNRRSEYYAKIGKMDPLARKIQIYRKSKIPVRAVRKPMDNGDIS